MNGWGNVFLTVTPEGLALPCHTAKMLKDITCPIVGDINISDIWYQSDGFNRYRADAWMNDPCHTCPDKEKDLGGCRCRAHMPPAMPQIPTRSLTNRPTPPRA
ncbi:MAG: hypothetical protein JZU64_06265 [Rhodoferax sp.]|jgi:pyrroloquinoline quinone biosynthesis protein E|nr:hypothetical protein [Rhodoferax sp.]